MVFKAKTRTCFDLLAKSLNKNDVLKKKLKHFPGKKKDKFVVGEKVLCKDYRNPNKKGDV